MGGRGGVWLGGEGLHACVRMGVCVWHPLQSVKPFSLTVFLESHWGGVAGLGDGGGVHSNQKLTDHE